jgi:hypothetical protein
LKPELLRRYLREFGDEPCPHFFPNIQHFLKRHFGLPSLIFVSLYGNEIDLLAENENAPRSDEFMGVSHPSNGEMR